MGPHPWWGSNLGSHKFINFDAIVYQLSQKPQKERKKEKLTSFKRRTLPMNAAIKSAYCEYRELKRLIVSIQTWWFRFLATFTSFEKYLCFLSFFPSFFLSSFTTSTKATRKSSFLWKVQNQLNVSMMYQILKHCKKSVLTYSFINQCISFASEVFADFCCPYIWQLTTYVNLRSA